MNMQLRYPNKIKYEQLENSQIRLKVETQYKEIIKTSWHIIYSKTIFLILKVKIELKIISTVKINNIQ